jgi:hypothetical protein
MWPIDEATDEQREVMVKAMTEEGAGYEQRAKASDDPDVKKKYTERAKSVKDAIEMWRSGGKQSRPRGRSAQTRTADSGEE